MLQQVKNKINSLIGLKTLAESPYYHADGTLHSKTRYMNQLFIVHAYFSARERLQSMSKTDDSVCLFFYEKT